jgi:hypothetical protein
VIPQKFEIFQRLSQSGKSQNVVRVHGTPTVYDFKEQKVQLESFVTSSECVKVLSSDRY